MANVLIAGGSGLVGQRLSALLHEQGHEVSWLSRSKDPSSPYPVYTWDTEAGFIEEGAIDQADYVINLAGAGIADRPWTEQRKELIISSRVDTAALLLEYFKKVKAPKAYLAASAVGYYGDRGNTMLNEGDGPGHGFLSESCLAWEAATDEIRKSGIRTVTVRIGIVLSTQGGALEKMLIPFNFFLGTYFGSGQQWYSWIHIDDLCGIFMRGIENEAMTETYNGVAPNPKTNETLTRTIGKAKQKPAIYLPAPAFILRTVMGEMSHAILDSTRVSSNKIEAMGYEFRFRELQAALEDLLTKRI